MNGHLRHVRHHLASAGLVVSLAVALAQAVPAAAQTFTACGDLRNGYGPFDYRKDKDKLPIVDSNHFTVRVENLIGGVTGSIGGDLDYTLRAFPNHHRALITMVRHGERLKSIKPPGANYTIECYFDRALRLAPDDAVSRMLFARYLHSLGRTAEAVSQLERTADGAGDNGFTHYNVGLIYMELGQPERALSQAHKAAALGFERPELRQQLEKAGKWQDPTK